MSSYDKSYDDDNDDDNSDGGDSDNNMKLAKRLKEIHIQLTFSASSTHQIMCWFLLYVLCYLNFTTSWEE